MGMVNRSLILAFLVGVLPGCGEPAGTKQSGLVVINVLDKELFDDCHIKGSMNLPFEMIDEQVESIDKQAEVVIYCSNYQCTSSEYVAKKLCEKGFCNVAVYEAGMAEWYQKGLPIEGAHAKAYLNKPSKAVVHDESSTIAIINTDELAHKMGVTLKDSDKAA